MSAEATGEVWRTSPYRGVLFTIQLAIADVVNDAHDNEFWMRADALAVKARTSRRTVMEGLATLKRDGWIVPLGRPRGGAVRYRCELSSHAMSPQLTSDVKHGDIPTLSERKGTQTERGERLAAAVAKCPANGHRLVEALVSLVVANGSKAPTPGAAWFDAARLLLTVDERPFAEALDVLRWSQADDFWRSNVMSMPTFREKYDRLRLASKRGDRGGAIDEDKIVRHLEDRRRAKEAG